MTLEKLTGYSFYNITLTRWLQAAPLLQDGTMPIWFALNNRARSSKNRFYVYSWYNKTNVTLTMKDEPCGKLPSVGCLSKMLNVTIKHADQVQYCNKQIYNPLLFNVPRWGVNVSFPSSARVNHSTDSQSIIYLGLSSLLRQLLGKENCSKSTVLLNPLEHNLVKPYVSENRTKLLFRRLKITRTHETKNYASVSTPNYYAPAPLSVRQFCDYTVLMYYLFYNNHLACSLRALYAFRLFSGNRTIDTHYGQFNISSLYGNIPDNETDIYNHDWTPISDVADSTQLRWLLRLPNWKNATYEKHSPLATRAILCDHRLIDLGVKYSGKAFNCTNISPPVVVAKVKSA